jgi:hypothetical protein
VSYLEYGRMPWISVFRQAAFCVGCEYLDCKPREPHMSTYEAEKSQYV